jgi:SAM-dependent methyltransferase
MTLTRCRSCESTALEPILDLGTQPLAHRFLHPESLAQPEARYPLRLVLCGGCGLAQLDETVAREEFLADDPGGDHPAGPLPKHAGWLARTLCGQYRLGPSDLVLEVGSGDGIVLRAFRWHGVRVLGVEPSRAAAALAQEHGIATVVRGFDERAAQQLRAAHGPARLLLARHRLERVADLHDFAAAARELLARDGVAVLETPHLTALYRKLAFDTVRHEQLCYFSLSVLRTLFARSGLKVTDACRVAQDGGSLVLHVVPEASPRPVSARVGRILEEEAELGLERPAVWLDFAARVAGLRRQLLVLLDAQLERGCTLAGYGAPVRGNTLLNYCGIGRERVPYLVDRSPYRQGLLSPGMHIPVHGPEQLMVDEPDLALLLEWNHADEIVKQQAEYQWRGGRFLLPAPEPRLLGAPAWSLAAR